MELCGRFALCFLNNSVIEFKGLSMLLLSIINKKK